VNSTSNSRIDWSGCWEQRSGRIICRWIACWTTVGRYKLGAIGGYSGGGSFQLEKFAIPPDGAPLIEADNDLSSVLSADQISDTEDCLDKALAFHDEDEWLEAETLYLLPDRQSNLRQQDDLLFGHSEPIDKSLLVLFSLIGLITTPTGEAIQE
jgi:hypothetical protein